MGYVSKRVAAEEGLPRNGWYPRRKKNPPVNYTGGREKHTERTDEAAVAEWLADDRIAACNVALVMEGTMAFDVDGPEGAEALRLLAEEIGEELPPAPYSSNRGPGALERHTLYRIPADLDLAKVQGVINKRFGGKLDIIHWSHRYVVAAPSIHPSGRVYAWYGEDDQPRSMPAPSDCPMLPESYVAWARAAHEDRLASHSRTAGTGVVRTRAEDNWTGEHQEMSESQVRYRADRALDKLRAELTPGNRHNAIRDYAFQMWHYSALFDSAAVCALVEQVKQEVRGEGLTGEDEETIENVLRAAADEGQWVADVVADDAYDFDPDQDAGAEDAPETENGFTDALIGGCLARERFAGRFQWADGLGWLKWDGQRWAEVSDKVANEDCRRWVLAKHREATVSYLDRRDAGKEVAATLQEDPKVYGWGKAQGGMRMAGFVKIASGVKGVFAEAHDFDTHDTLINTPEGVVDMLTLEVRKHDPALLMTKITKGNLRPELLGDPLVKAALYAFPEDTHEWLQVRAGEACTGLGGKELLMLDGIGNNGKTGITGGLRYALGSYAAAIASTLLMQGERKGQATPEKIVLRGLRFGFIEETPEAAHLDAAMVKSLFDAAEISGRALFKNQMTWKPSHSIILNTNHVPTVVDTDHGPWRRLKRIRCPYRFRDVDGGEALELDIDRPGDPSIKHRLSETQHGHDAVLTWALYGAQKLLQAASLAQAEREPASVREAVQDWRLKSDDILKLTGTALRFNPETYVVERHAYRAFSEMVKADGGVPPRVATFRERLLNHSALAGKVAYKQVRLAKNPRPGSPVLSEAPVTWLQGDATRAVEWAYVGLEFVPFELDQG